MAYSIHILSTGMARAWDAQGKSIVYISGQATMVLGRQYALDSFNRQVVLNQGGNTAGGVIENQGECD